MGWIAASGAFVQRHLPYRAGKLKPALTNEVFPCDSPRFSPNAQQRGPQTSEQPALAIEASPTCAGARITKQPIQVKCEAISAPSRSKASRATANAHAD
jgi:hypothetical protein